MKRFVLKRGSNFYNEDLRNAILIFARKLASVMAKLSEHDARIVAFALDPSLDGYVLGGWDKSDIIQEAIETMVARNYNPSEMDELKEDNLYDIVDSINSGMY